MEEDSKSAELPGGLMIHFSNIIKCLKMSSDLNETEASWKHGLCFCQAVY